MSLSVCFVCCCDWSYLLPTPHHACAAESTATAHRTILFHCGPLTARHNSIPRQGLPWKTKSLSPHLPDASLTDCRVLTTAPASPPAIQPSSPVTISPHRAWKTTMPLYLVEPTGRDDTEAPGGARRCWIPNGNERTSRTSGW